MSAAMPVALACALLLPLLAGCTGRDRFDEARPDDWKQGAALWAYQGGKSHDADETYWLRVADAGGTPSGAPQPARCVAYQDGRHAAGDTCTVFPPGQDSWAGEDILAWTIEASWDGRGQRLHEDVERNPGGRTVVAFGADGAVAAHWDGVALAPNGTFATE